MHKRGLFITFEGPDGAGKTTQIKHIAAFLSEKGIPFMTTREPGGTAISDHIRALLLDPSFKTMQAKTEVLLYAASRAQHVEEKIKPALDEGYIVLCDRFVDASIAYQGYGLHVGDKAVREINAFATGDCEPDRTYYIDLSPEEGKARMLARVEGSEANLDRIEQKDMRYHQTVREGFQTLAKEESQRIKTIDGTESIDHVTNTIISDVIQLWEQHQDKK